MATAGSRRNSDDQERAGRKKKQSDRGVSANGFGWLRQADGDVIGYLLWDGKERFWAARKMDTASSTCWRNPNPRLVTVLV
jgi:hypothetical protein